MKKHQAPIDGFVPRQPRSPLGQQQRPRIINASSKTPASKPDYRPLRTAGTTDSRPDSRVENRIGEARSGYIFGEAAKQYDEGKKSSPIRSDISESLNEIDDESFHKGRKGGRRKKDRLASPAPEKPRHKRRKRIIITVVVLLVLAILGTVGYIGYTIFNASGNVLQGNVFELLKTTPLKEDENGRSNFLVIGTSEDDPGHQGGSLTDSILVVSVDQDQKTASMFSVPRDLYVDYELEACCAAGCRGKINAYFTCVGGDSPETEAAALESMRGFIGNIFDLDIQYAVHVNYTVVRDVINSIGGSVTVNVEGNGATPAGIPAGSVMDSNFDWKCGANYVERMKNCAPRGHFIDYGPGDQVMDAEHALYFAQARGASYDGNSWGLAQSNFDREKNQQKVVVAIKEKALSSGTLTNIGAVTGMINALGSNLRTNIQTGEVRTLMSLAQDIATDQITSISLIDAEPQLLSTGSPIEGAGSIVFPTAGVYMYDDLRAFIAKSLSSDPVVREGAIVSVLNGSGVPGAAQYEANKLTDKFYTVDEVADAPEGEWAQYTVYQISSDKSGTAKALAALYQVKVTTTEPPFSVTGDTDFVVVVGPQPTTSEE